ncbi:MAG: alpha/beta hydrolase, partial [Ilumatobacteraceae bacterium]
MSESLLDQTITLSTGRRVGVADFGSASTTTTSVLWCHGGPGSRLEPAHVADAARAAGMRLIGIDRPGYGLSPPQPGRTIGDWVPEALEVADSLGIDRFVTVGVSSGGAFALAVAALAPERVLGVVSCCALTDMRNRSCRATMSKRHALDVWDAPDRDSALAAATEAHGAHGERMGMELRDALPASDLALFRDPVWFGQLMAEGPSMFAYGLQGYTDDRIADRDGWTEFDVHTIRCPVTVLQGDQDIMISVEHARYTASLIPGAQLRLIEGAGHFS